MLLLPANSDLLLELSLDNSTALWACSKITMDLRGIEPTLGFSPGFHLKFDSPDGNTGVSPMKTNKKYLSANMQISYSDILGSKFII